MKHDCIHFLGCAWSQIPLAFDIIYETLGVKDFRIFKNITVEDDPVSGMIPDIYRWSVHEPEESANLTGDKFVFGVTGPKAKFAVLKFFTEKYGIGLPEFTNILHPTSYMATSARLAQGIFIEPKVIISSLALIGNAVTLKRGVSIGHNSVIGEYTEINPGVTISGHTTIGRGCIIGLGAVLKNKITIGDNSYIGMGSVVTGDIPPGVIAYGNPCKVIRENDGWKI